MIVISKIANKKLLKGHRYEVFQLWNSGNNQRWVEGKLQISGFGRYSVHNFTDTSGNPIANIDFKTNQVLVNRFIKFEDVSEGEVLVCSTDRYKTLAKDRMYRVEKLEKVEYERTGYNGQKWTSTDYSVRFEGVTRKIKFNGWAFRKLTSEESREISLNTILHNKQPEIIKTSKIRKIDLVQNKEKTLMEFLSMTLLDRNRHHLSVIDWTCKKTGEKFGITPEDFNSLLELPLKDILTKIDNNQ